MRKVTWLCLVLAATAAAQSSGHYTLEARVGKLRTSAGKALVFGDRVVPPLWGAYRTVDFQLRGPLVSNVPFEVRVELLEDSVELEAVSSQTGVTDKQGRFFGVYGLGARRRDAAWPAGSKRRELYHFRVGERTIGSFLVEMSPTEVRIQRVEEKLFTSETVE
jgi:hypothetical protein